jgi:phospholipid:diacylglycerol acyltransferase
MPTKKRKSKNQSGTGAAAAAESTSATTSSSSSPSNESPSNVISQTQTSPLQYVIWILSVLVVAIAIHFATTSDVTAEHRLKTKEAATSLADSLLLSVDQAVNSTAMSLLPYSELFANLSSIMSSAEEDGFRRQWNKLQASILASTSENATMVGDRMAHSGTRYKAKHPVFLIPGFVTSGLELWDGQDCAKPKYFRKKVWGSLETFKSFVNNPDCWKTHLSLDPVTGLDPDPIRLRASQGFEAADFWTSAFWVWDRIIRNLAAVGYDESNMSMEAYDWRMSYPQLEQRDGRFTKLKKNIEAFVETSGEKAVLIGHSMGGPCAFFFLVWVSKSKEEGGGGGGDAWVEQYIHSYINLAGPMLGLPKATAALLSGEMKDTNILSTFGSILESLFGRKKRHELFSSWGSLWGMIPKGGDAIWGVAADLDCGPGRIHSGDKCVEVTDDTITMEPSIPFLSLNQEAQISYDNPTFAKYAAKSTWSFDEVIDYLSEWKQGHHGPTSLQGTGSWNDPTQHPLPNAPSLKVYCMYGVGLPTERMFFYKNRNKATLMSRLSWKNLNPMTTRRI